MFALGSGWSILGSYKRLKMDCSSPSPLQLGLPLLVQMSMLGGMIVKARRSDSRPALPGRDMGTDCSRLTPPLKHLQRRPTNPSSKHDHAAREPSLRRNPRKK